MKFKIGDKVTVKDGTKQIYSVCDSECLYNLKNIDNNVCIGWCAESSLELVETDPHKATGESAENVRAVEENRKMKYKVGDKVLYYGKVYTIMLIVNDKYGNKPYLITRGINSIYVSEESISLVEKGLDSVTEQRQQDINWIKEHIEEVKMGDFDEAQNTGESKSTQIMVDCYMASLKAEYEKGLNDAWELVRRLRTTDPTDLIKIFDKYVTYSVVEELSASEAVAKWKAWEEKNEIKVGDEVILNFNAGLKNKKAIVLAYDGSLRPYNVLVNDGYTEWVKEDAIECKTGRHFDEISEVLNQLQEDQK